MLENPDLHPSSVLAITYTNNAVDEIRTRVRERLQQMATVGPAELSKLLAEIGLPTDEASMNKARNLYRSYILARPPISVYTFHGWFNHIVNSLPWEAQPSLKSQIVTNEEKLRQTAWQATLQQALSNSKLEESLRYMLGWHKLMQIRELLDSMLEKRLEWYLHFGLAPEDEGMEKVFSTVLDETMPRPDVISKEQLHVDESFIKLRKLLLQKSEGSNRKTLQKFHSSLLQAHTSKDPAAMIAYARQAVFNQKNKPYQALLKLATKENFYLELTSFITTLEQEHELTKWHQAHCYNNQAVHLGIAYARNYAAAKQQQGLIDFTDMELIPLRTLFSQPTPSQTWSTNTQAGLDLLARMDASYRHILVDEFQDTSPAQWQVLRAWLEASASGTHQPSVFLVGDPKQAIFGFQGGTPYLLQTAANFLTKYYAGEQVFFNTTRRCAPEIVTLVNQIFGDQQFDRYDPIEFAGFQEHETTQTNLAGMACVIVPPEPATSTEQEQEEQEEIPPPLRNPLTTPAPATDPTRKAVAEGKKIATVMKQILTQGRITTATGTRPCTIDDIMMIYPTRAGIEPLVNELAKVGIACAAPGTLNRLHSLECRDIMALLQAIYDPQYALAVAQVLRSPIFAVPEADLWQVYKAGITSGTTSARKTANWVTGLRTAQGSPHLARAQELLQAWRAAYRNDKLPAHEMLARCYHDADIIQRYVQAVPLSMRKQVVQNLEWILNLGIEADGGRYAQLADYHTYLRHLAQNKVGTGPAATQHGVLRTCSVHSAKGLESPVVIFINMNFSSQKEHAQLLVGWDHENNSNRPSHVSFLRRLAEATKSQTICAQLNKNANEREKLNMLYVGITRAQQVLVMSARRFEGAHSKWLKRADWALKKLAVPVKNGMRTYGKYPKLAPGATKSAPDPLPAEQTPTLPEPAPETKHQVGFRNPTPGVALRRGTLLHNLLALRLSGVDNPTTLRRLLAVSTNEFNELSCTADGILNTSTEFGALVNRSAKCEVELPLISATGQELRADCVLETKDETWILDFKTGLSSKDNQENQQQLQDYVAVIQANTNGRKVYAALVGLEGKLTRLAS